jgi:hypothetical protein
MCTQVNTHTHTLRHTQPSLLNVSQKFSGGSAVKLHDGLRGEPCSSINGVAFQTLPRSMNGIVFTVPVLKVSRKSGVAPQ